MSTINGRARARRFVQHIANEHGYLGEEVYSKMDSETRRQVEEALLKKDEMIGSSVITLAKNLYTKDVRFIFELLQNADDNRFSRATGLGAVPYVSFRVYKDRIVVECNEDGFCERDLVAICNVGKSSKTEAQGYIGEKGIGFKSVFKVAWRVHIQSGDYSFHFRHRKGDSGMGMISPEWQEPSGPFDDTLTRTTLFLHAEDDGQREDSYSSIVQQLNELQPAMLLFLKNLQRIETYFYDDSGSLSSSIILSISYTGGVNRPVLERVETKNNHAQTTRQKFYVLKATARGLPRNENRDYTALEESTKAYSTAPIILAFPLSDDDVPVISPQEIYAFLPIRRVGFNFLIHSDFVTQANREDVVSTSSRNIKLLEELSQAFVTAIRELCQHPALRYQWMRYLPESSTYPWDPFWQKLVDKIKSGIGDEEIMFRRDESLSPTTMKRVKRLLLKQSDRDKKPLFRDLDGALATYISAKYTDSDLDILSEYGVTYMTHDLYLDRVKTDLSTDSSRLKTITSPDWQSRVAISLSLCFTKGGASFIERTKKLNLIPLTDGTYTCAAATVFFSTTTNGIPVPRDLGLRLVNPKASELSDWKKMLVHLGVRHPAVADVRSMVLRRYSAGIPEKMSFSISKEHLLFLYLTHTEDITPNHYGYLFIYGTDSKLHPLKGTDSHLVGDGTYQLWNLLGKADHCHSFEKIYFLEQAYFDSPPEIPGHGISFHQWLHKSLGVRKHARLVSPDGSALSEECRFIADQLPKDFLGFLRSTWPFEGKSMERNVLRMNDLKELEVLCKGNVTSSLASGYLPSSDLTSEASLYMRTAEFFPLLDLGDIKSSADELDKWSFLKKLGVKGKIDLTFYLDILSMISYNNVRRPGAVLEDSSRVPRLYLRIYAMCIGSRNKEDDQALVQREIDGYNCIYVPPYRDEYQDKAGCWVDREACAMEAPVDSSVIVPIFERYKLEFLDLSTNFHELQRFFEDTLQIQEYSWSHVVAELAKLQESPEDDCRVWIWYDRLRDWEAPAMDVEDIRKSFEEKSLVFFATENGRHWWKPSECLWGNRTHFGGSIDLSIQYDQSFEHFFVATLGVRKLTAAIVYEQLMSLDLQGVAIDRIKDILRELNSQLREASLDIPPKAMLQRPVLPVKDEKGNVSLCSVETQFAIVDRRLFGEMFSGEVKVLDFDLNEVCHLHPFLEWSGLNERLLSRLVKETSVVDSSMKVPISERNQDIRLKAYGMLRIATHFHSPRISGEGQAFYDLLRNTKTWETDGISKRLSIFINEKSFSKETDRGELHIEESAEVVNIYVPHNEDSRDVCYLSALPNKMVEWMMHSSASKNSNALDKAVSIVKSILTAKPSLVDGILESEGIVESKITAIPESSESAEDDPFSASSSLSIPKGTIISNADARAPAYQSPPRTPGGAMFDSDSEGEDTRQYTPATDYAPYTSPRTFHPTPTRDGAYGAPNRSLRVENSAYDLYRQNGQRHQVKEYRDLLLQVVNAARGYDFSRSFSDAFGPRRLMSGGSAVEYRTFRESDLFGLYMPHHERHKKVGAAGELFVFELLSSARLSLRGFSRENWRSNIRKYATAHPDYADMSPWSEPEITDMEYLDEDGTVTKFLVSKHHLPAEWRDRRPRYYIEVKSTPGGFETPFFMSDAQYKKMRTFSTDNSVYIIFRVFNLYTDQVGVQIYVNPAQLEERGELVFTTDKWTVKPQMDVWLANSVARLCI